MREDVRFRLAPHNESKESENLDAMVVIPSFDEGTHILDTIYTAIAQKQKERSLMSHGVTVVINNRPDSGQRIKESNFNTYVLLQALEHRFPISLKGASQEINNKIKEIQNSGVPIHIIDSFSEGNASAQNNVGRARKLGTEYALPLLKHEGFVVSTDADTKLGPLLIESTRLFFKMSDQAAVEFTMHRDMDGTTEEERRANAANSLYWDLRALSSTDNQFEDSLVWMSGGGSAFRRTAYEAIGGYRELPGEEDTYLGIDMADKGLKITNTTPEDLVVSTRGRFSERASTGLGRSILKWSKERGAFHEVKIPSFESVLRSTDLYQSIEIVYSISLRSWCSRNGLDDKEFNKLQRAMYSSDSRDDPRMQAFLADTEEKDRRRKIFSDVIAFKLSPDQKEKVLDLLDTYRPNEVSSSAHHDLYNESTRIFKEKYPDQTVGDFVDSLEQHTLEYEKSQREHEENIGFELDQQLEGQTYERFKERSLAILRRTDLDLSDPEVSTKVRIGVLIGYRAYQHDVATAVMGFRAQQDAQKILQERGGPAPDDVLVLVRFEKEMIDALLENGYFKAQMMALEHVERTMLHETGDHVKKQLRSERIEMQEAYRKFLGAKFLPITSKYKDENLKNIELFKKALIEQGEMEAAES